MGAFSSKATTTVSNFRPPVYNSMVDAIGNTPLILLKGPSERTGCKIYGKAEFLNPGGSVKDRAAKSLIETLEKEGKLKPGVSTVVEGTAGNTGIGLSYVCNAKGYKTVIVIPRTQSQEKKDTLRQAGASLVEVDAMGYKFPSERTHLTHPPAVCHRHRRSAPHPFEASRRAAVCPLDSYSRPTPSLTHAVRRQLHQAERPTG
jgi:cysteine synthase